MKADDLGDRMKTYEQAEAGRKLMPLLPVIARIDGRCFSSFTRGMNRPYDQGMIDLMIAVTEKLVEETSARIGYTQSDEISLVWKQDRFNSELFFNGKIQKMVSGLAALATGHFNNMVKEFFPECVKMATFDCRVWNVPNQSEATNAILWREKDATKNSISMAARSVFSHKDLQNKNSDQMQGMLYKAGINWNDYPSFFKRGTFVQRRKVLKAFSTEELENLPERHAARQNPDLVVERTETRRLQMPPFGTVSNKDAVIFYGADPEVKIGN